MFVIPNVFKLFPYYFSLWCLHTCSQQAIYEFRHKVTVFRKNICQISVKYGLLPKKPQKKPIPSHLDNLYFILLLDNYKVICQHNAVQISTTITT